MVSNNDSLTVDSSLAETISIFNNPFRDINNFDIKVGNYLIDSLHTLLSKKTEIEMEYKKAICLGDNCTSFKTYMDKATKTKLCFFKGDVGEYGFSNDQFILTNDSISVVRNFNVNIEIWPSDSSETLWKIEEIVYYFYSDRVKTLEKKSFTKDLYKFDFTLETIPYDISTVYGTNLFKEKTNELTELLTIENSDE